MYDHDAHPELYRLSSQQFVSLEKHRQMLRDAARWQEASRLADEEPRSETITHLRTLLVDLLSPVIKRGRIAMFELDHVLNGSGSRSYHQEMVRQAQQEKPARQVAGEQGSDRIIPRMLVLLFALAHLVKR